jgi:hypothetical protein
LATAAKKLGRKALRQLDTLVTPDTLLRWYRRLVARKYDSSAQRESARPRRKPDIVELVLRMAKENPTWGYTRIRGALHNLGHDIGRNTIKRVLLEAGMAPAPERGKRRSWSAFLRAHWDAIAAMDFFTVEVVTWAGLVRYHVLFVIELATPARGDRRHLRPASRSLDEADGTQPHGCGRWLSAQASLPRHRSRSIVYARLSRIACRQRCQKYSAASA